MRKANKFLAVIGLAYLIVGYPSSAQTVLKTLYAFPPNGASAFPVSALTQALDGNYYGTSETGGNGAACSVSVGCGTLFRVTPEGVLTTLYNFCSLPGCADGAYPYPKATLVQGSDGALYGTTWQGGASTLCSSSGCGSIFRVTTSGAFTTLYSFCTKAGCPDGQFPVAGLAQGADGDFYGMTLNGGANQNSSCFSNNTFGIGCGTAFKIDAIGNFTPLYSFCGSLTGQGFCQDGNNPYSALIQGSDGKFYGTTSGGGANSAGGTVFTLTPAGQLTTLYSFCALTKCGDGSWPFARLTEASNGTFFGITVEGGVEGYTTDPCTTGCGTIFAITSAGEFSSIYSFCIQKNCADGRNPEGGLIEGHNRNLYGTTLYGGSAGEGPGTIFTVTPAGVLTKLYRFCKVAGCADGYWPTAELAQTSQGNFYGTTGGGAATIFLLSGSTITPSSATYAKRPVGTTSAPKKFVLVNKDGVTLQGLTISTTGDFGVSSTTCITTLAAKAGCAIYVTFTPTQKGARTGLLRISDSANNSPQTSSLSGTGY